MPEEESTDIDRTEPQRRALEEMSQSLLVKLEAMVAEQEARAQEFAERVHSLSPLPQVSPLPDVSPVSQPARSAPAASESVSSSVQPRRVSAQAPPLVRKTREAVAEALPPHRRRGEVARERGQEPEKKEGGVNVGLLMVVSVILFILMKSCN